MLQPPNPFDSPVGVAPEIAAGDNAGDATGGIIPYKNMPALLAYYLGLASLIPCFGFFLGIASFVLGIIGLRKRAQNPAVKGSVHAWIGIVLGGLMTLVWGAAIFISMLAPLMQRN